MKVVILAINGLDYDMMVRFKTLRQTEFGKVDYTNVPLITTIVWASFITGLYPKDHGVDMHNDKIREGVKTIFHEAKKPIALWIPSWNPHPKYWHPYHMYLLPKAAAGDRGSFIVYEKEIHNLFNEQREVFLQRLDEDFDLIMAHFNYIDAMGHAVRNLEKMMKYVVLVDKFVYDVIQKLNKKFDRYFLLIISDHGLEHNPNGCYSSNIQLNLKKPHITDFYRIIVEMLKK